MIFSFIPILPFRFVIEHLKLKLIENLKIKLIEKSLMQMKEKLKIKLNEKSLMQMKVYKGRHFYLRESVWLYYIDAYFVCKFGHLKIRFRHLHTPFWPES